MYDCFKLHSQTTGQPNIIVKENWDRTEKHEAINRAEMLLKCSQTFCIHTKMLLFQEYNQ